MDHDADSINNIVLPLINVPRPIKNGVINPFEPQQCQFWMTSAGVRNSFAYDKLIEMLGFTILNPRRYSVIGCSYKVPLLAGVLSKDYLNEIKSSKTFSEASFAAEYLSLWQGTTKDSSGSFASRLVRVYRRDTGSLVGEVVSNESTGTYKVIAANSGTTTPRKHFAVCHDPSAISIYRVLGLHCDGTNGSTTFTDVCGKTVTANGNAQISTAQYPALTGKTSSALFDGTGDYLSIPDSEDFNLGGSNFSIRIRFRLAGWANNNGGFYYSTLVSQWVAGDTAYAIDLNGTVSSYTNIYFQGYDTSARLVSVSVSLSLNTWYELEVTRSGNTVYIILDGTLLNAGGTAFSYTIRNSSTTLKIGGSVHDGTYPSYFNGYIS